jgi:hypothetical protein
MRIKADGKAFTSGGKGSIFSLPHYLNEVTKWELGKVLTLQAFPHNLPEERN